ncbi:MAG: sulfite exporter TauE/SafE family protein, partial [Alphaproteobacteria bacterium]|nr:sulfite exporter TauE/SafE family protein [Alphaproteobacteria bacterium]
MEFTVIAVVTTAFLLGGLSKGIAGMGLPTVALAVLGSALGVQGAIALMVVPAFVTNIWQALVGGPVMTLVRRFWLLLLTSVVGAWLGVAILLAADARTMRMALGVALCAYGAVSLAARPITIPPRLDRGVQPLVGAATGLISGMTGTIVMP